MTDKHMSIAEARAAVDAAAKRVAERKQDLMNAEAAHSSACVALRSAMLRADEALPKAVMVTIDWLGSKRCSCDVVIVRRTAKQINVRIPGDTTVVRSFRQDRYGAWFEYPRGGRYSGTFKLELAE